MKTISAFKTMMLTAILAVCFGMMGQTACAQETTKDNGALRDIAKQAATLVQKTQKVTQIARTVNDIMQIDSNINAAIGSAGEIIDGFSINNLVNSLQTGLSSAENGATRTIFNTLTQPASSKDVSQLAPIEILSQIQQYTDVNQMMSTLMGSASFPGSGVIQALANGLSGNETGQQSYNDIMGSLYANSQQPSGDDIQNVNIARKALLSNQTSASMAEADAIAQAETNNGPKVIKTLTEQGVDVVDKRRAEQGNTATTIKMIDEQRTTNVLLSRLVQLEAAYDIATQPSQSPSQMSGNGAGFGTNPDTTTD